MKVVLDTNVFVSGIFFSGPPNLILKAWKAGLVKIVLSYEILDEYRRVGEELSTDFPGIDMEHVLNLITIQSTILAPLL